MRRPRPRPAPFVVNDGSNARLADVSSMPGPSSVTVTHACDDGATGRGARSGRDRHVAAGHLDRLGRVDEQVHHELLQLERVALDTRCAAERDVQCRPAGINSMLARDALTVIENAWAWGATRRTEYVIVDFTSTARCHASGCSISPPTSCCGTCASRTGGSRRTARTSLCAQGAISRRRLNGSASTIVTTRSRHRIDSGGRIAATSSRYF